MRTTLTTIYSRINTNLGKITTDMSKINDQISSGLQMAKISDEPVNLVSALRFRSAIVELDQYTENIQSGNTIITAAESALTQMKEISLRAKTLAIQATDPAYTTANREAIAVEIKNMFEQAVSLANTQVNGKYIFGGFRTTGYTEVEPAPFVIDKGDGYWVNGTTPAPLPAALTSGTISTTDLAANNLFINGVDIGAVVLNVATPVGINMTGANNLSSKINQTTGLGLYADSTANPDPAGTGMGNVFSFDLNGVPVTVATDGLEASSAAVSNKAIAAINTQTATTGVTAFLGTGANGGPAGAVVFQNVFPAASNATITVANLSTDGLGTADLGFTNFEQNFVTASLTTMTSGAAAPVGGAAAGQGINFTINNIPITYSTVQTLTANETALETVAAINAVKEQTGVTAMVGDGSNGGLANAVILKNTRTGDASAITLAGLGAGMTTVTGLSNVAQVADATHNSGQISLSSGAAISITTSSADDTILTQIGLGGGGKGNVDQAADGQLVYGYPLTSAELKINGFEAPDPIDDNLSDIYADASATAKATAINSITGQTGVTAVVLPSEVSASGGVSGGIIGSNDLIINGSQIFTLPIAVAANDSDNALLDAINAKTTTTGVQATRDVEGLLHLTATDGRNIHLQLSTNGEALTHLANGNRDQVYFGALQLRSDRKFILETVAPATNPGEPGLAALGLAGGEDTSGEPNDAVGDGKIEVFSIHDRSGSVRYAGDRVNDLSIKIGKTNTMTVGENGKTGIMDTTIFTTLKAMEDYLMGTNFTTVTGIHPATDRAALLNSRVTGLEPVSLLPSEDLFQSGSFTVSILDHDYYPPQTTAMTIGVDPEVDTLDSITKRIDGIPHLSASWTTLGKLEIASADPARYTIALSDDTSNFLAATGVSADFMQSQGIMESIANLDTLMENLTKQVSDFGARANRIDIQSQIYSTMTIATKENLSEAQDTDMIKAVMDLKAKETAYQAALSAAAKTMQLSLVDYLR